MLKGWWSKGAFFGSGSLKVRLPHPNQKVLCCLCEGDTVFSKVDSLTRWQVVMRSLFGEVIDSLVVLNVVHVQGAVV